MQKTLLCSMLAIAGLLCGGCNGDIFVEPAPNVSENYFYLDGNGGSASFTIPTKGLRNVRFGSNFSPLDNVNYYGKDGELLYNPTFDDVAKAVYGSPQFCISFDVDGDKVKATALDNTTDENIKIWVSLDYQHETKSIDFEISPGRPLEISDLAFFFSNAITSQHSERGIPHTYSNSSDQTARVTVYPLKEATSKIKLQIEQYDYWANGVKGYAQVPGYINGEWSHSDTSPVEVRLGDITQFYSPFADSDEGYLVEVAPQSKVTIVTEIEYSTLETSYIATLRQPGSGLEFPSQGTCQLMQPVSYKIYQ